MKKNYKAKSNKYKYLKYKNKYFNLKKTKEYDDIFKKMSKSYSNYHKITKLSNKKINVDKLISRQTNLSKKNLPKGKNLSRQQKLSGLIKLSRQNNIENPYDELKYVDSEKLKLPKKLLPDEIYKDIEGVKSFLNTSMMLISGNSKIIEEESNRDNITFMLETKDKSKYFVKAVPIYSINDPTGIMCWSWNGNTFMDINNLTDEVVQIRDKITKYANDNNLDFLDFDCLDNIKDINKMGQLFSEILLLGRYLMDYKGYFVLAFPYVKDNKKGVYVEHLFVETIEKIK